MVSVGHGGPEGLEVGHSRRLQLSIYSTITFFMKLFSWNKMANEQTVHKEIHIKNVMQLLVFYFKKYG